MGSTTYSNIYIVVMLYGIMLIYLLTYTLIDYF